MSVKIFEMKGISKHFPGVKALDNVDFNIYKGQVMALLGENGAGKSTLMKIMSGVYSKTSGEMFMNGSVDPIVIDSPRAAQKHGISIIHQELNLIEELSIGENIFLGREPRKALGKVDWKKLYSESSNLLNMFNIDIDPRIKVKELSIGNKQMVEIAKALSLDAEIIIMDEPTDALTETETKSLFAMIEKLKASSKSIVYISHRLNEIFEICDYVTVLRDGQFISENHVADINEDKLIEMMVGRKLEEQYPYMQIDLKDTVLEVMNLSNKYVNDINFKLRKGEILGVAGLMGSGRTELGKTLFGAYKADEGKIIINGEPVVTKSPRAGIKAGITYVSEDRKKDGLVLHLSVKQNMSLSSLIELSKLYVLDKSKEKEIVNEYVDKISIKTPSENQVIKKLSGGNQQKVSIAKSLMTNPDILILDEPTRGVDVGAKKEIYDLMNEFKAEGMSIIMISSEIPEILGMCDRVMVMHEGTVSGVLERSEATQEKIMRYAVGLK